MGKMPICGLTLMSVRYKMESMQISDSEKDNILKWRGQRGFYEVYYIKFNHLSTRTAFWIRYTLLSPVVGDPVAELWAIFFDAENPTGNLAFKRTYPISGSEYSKEHFYFRIQNAELLHNSLRGKIEKESNFIQWDLNFIPNAKTFYHFPYSFMYKFKIPKTKVLSPNFNIKLNGRIVVNRREFICNGEPGHETHIWGTKHAERWVWANCNAFSNGEGIFEGLSAQIRAGKILTPPLTPLYVMFSGKEYYMNGLWQSYKNFSLNSIPEWKFSGDSGGFRFEGTAWSDVKNFVGVEYTDPDGEKLWCYNTKVANMVLKVFKGDRKIGELTSENTTALEFVSRMKDERIPVLI